MTRVEHHTEEDHEQLKREITDELRTEERRRRMKWLLIRTVIVLVIIFVPLFWIGSAIARTGLVTVPLLTSHMYEPASPVREVVPLVGSTPTDIVNTIGARSRYDLSNGLVTTTASEQELTTLVRHAAANVGDSPLPVNEPQVAIEDGYLEFSAVTPRDGREVPIIVRAVPSAKDGRLDAEIREIIVGGYTVPDALVNAAFAVVGKNMLDSAQQAIDRLGVLRRIDLTKGSVQVIFEPGANPGQEARP